MKIALSLSAVGMITAVTVSAQLHPIAASAVGHGAATKKVTFWGYPFPYRYSWGRARTCTRYVLVETPRGVRYQRIWVCSPGGPVGRYRY
jgi:hypothetical protein